MKDLELGVLEAAEVLKQHRRNPKPEQPSLAEDVANLRARLGLTQQEFAVRYGLKIGTVRNWEQGRGSRYDPATRLLLRMIERDPDGAADLAIDLELA